MEPTPPTAETQIEAQGGGQTWIWLVAGGGLLATCCVSAVLVIAMLTVMGPAVGKVYSTINASLDTSNSYSSEITVVTPEPFAYQENDNALGDPNAPVKIVEYGDFQCPYCAHFWRDTEKVLIRDYVETGKVYFVYRSFGIFIGPESGRAAEAAYCAGAQGRFWEYHDMLFANQGPENTGTFGDANLNIFAGQTGLDPAKFTRCLASGQFKERVLQDAADGEKSNVHATPSFVINEKQLIEGAQPYSAFQEAIEKLLDK